MKLARKLTLAILAVMIAVFALNAAERIQRDRRALREDIQRDHRSLARALQVVVRESFREDGEQRALSLVEAANQRESAMQIRWLWVTPGKTLQQLNASQTARLSKGHDVELVSQKLGMRWLYSYAPVLLHDGRVGALELSESLASEDEILRSTVWRTALSTVAIAALAALVTAGVGLSFVGRPVAALTEKARRVGAGDLSGPIVLTQRDELGDLAREMNAMCDRLEGEMRARQQALAQLRHAERLNTVGRLAAGVAHELGTPLQVVGLEAKRIAVGRGDAVEGAQIVVAQVERMSTIIRQLLDFARQRTPHPARVELAELARGTAQLVATLASRGGVTLAVQGTPVHVNADAGQLQQVLTNLIVNALQASVGGVVTVETGQERERAFLRVSDRGVGIAAEALPRIFEPFFTTKDVGQGTGLGLAVAHGIVEEHGGQIDVESELGQGARFTVWLPSLEAV
ncbi:MAG TPA: HAMP domain-containing sensor histidine kinase [Polyangiales bacterium]|nr:HAMP domain-containing sensor histidine kinase [Polyangiales bacterium]